MELDSYRNVSAGQSRDQVEVAGIEPCPTIWNPRDPLVPRTKPRKPCDPFGTPPNPLLTPSTPSRRPGHKSSQVGADPPSSLTNLSLAVTNTSSRSQRPAFRLRLALLA